MLKLFFSFRVVLKSAFYGTFKFLLALYFSEAVGQRYYVKNTLARYFMIKET